MTEGSYDPFEKARLQALRLLQTQARSTHELRQRLLRSKHTAKTVDQVLARLTDVGLLDDRRFAIERAIYLSQRKGQGPRKLKADLVHLGVAADMIDAALAHAYQSTSADQMMREVLLRRFGEKVFAQDTDQKLLAKAQRFLLTRGFEPDAVFALLSR
jgi:regulatory protein